MQYEKGVYFSIDFWLLLHPSWFFPLRAGRGGRGGVGDLSRQNPLIVWKTLFVNSPLILHYYMLGADHPNNVKRRCKFIFKRKLKLESDRNSLILSVHTLWVSYDFLVKSEMLLNHVRVLNSSFLVRLGGFNVRSKSWWCEHISSPESH